MIYKCSLIYPTNTSNCDWSYVYSPYLNFNCWSSSLLVIRLFGLNKIPANLLQHNLFFPKMSCNLAMTIYGWQFINLQHLIVWSLLDHIHVWIYVKSPVTIHPNISPYSILTRLPCLTGFQLRCHLASPSGAYPGIITCDSFDFLRILVYWFVIAMNIAVIRIPVKMSNYSQKYFLTEKSKQIKT